MKSTPRDTMLGTIQVHMEVVGSDGEHVGTVDHVVNERLKLTKNDPAAGGEHHFIDGREVASVDDKVHLKVPAATAQATWAPDGGLDGVQP